MSPATSHQPTVLVVDDDADLLYTLAHMLQIRGFHVLTASDTATAMTLCAEQSNRIEALVADVSLPGEAPGELARTISEVHPQIKVVYATGIPRHVAVSSGLVRTDVPYVQKPVDPDVLAGTLRSVLLQNAARDSR